MCASKEITLTHGSQTKVHRVGPFTGMNAVMFWGAIVAAVATAAAMVTPKWRTYRSYHEGLWRSCSEWGCVTMTYPDMQDWFNAMRGLVSLALIASVVTLVLAVVYTFFHSVNKNVVLTLFIVASWLSAPFMIAGFSYYGGKFEKHFGYSFYLAIGAAVLHILIGIAGGIQKSKSG